ncbi:transketolase [Allocatelliglobosispora scoriae]|uniref:Transketolase n=1 Tax=Allocatelliglobosispora scoriae TaxID=643052 RepID=A0A841C1I1_9ACTN|nr:transketolase [Allocatelliglobosispora scoriae]MBB5873003.1 transketolase [Allocatelliglobosispora scoriae]
MRNRFVETTADLLDHDPRLAVVLAEITAAAFEPVAARHPDRVINVGIREQLLISAAGGLALTGLRPIVHTISSFLIERPFEQIKLDLNHLDVGAVLVGVGASYDVAAGGRTHQSPGDVALLDTLPGWTVHVPGHADEAEALLRHAAADGDSRVYLRLSTQVNAAARPVAPGRFATVRTGRAAVVLAVGPMLDPVLAATEGLDVTVLYASTVRPFDDAGLRAAVGAASAEIVLVEPYLAGTSVPQVARALAAAPHRTLALGVRHEELRRYGTPDDHARLHGLDPAGLRAAISAFLPVHAG